MPGEVVHRSWDDATLRMYADPSVLEHIQDSVALVALVET